MRKAIFYGAIKDGKLVLDQRQLFDVWLGAQKHDERIELVIQSIARDKTNQQLGYYFGVLIPALVEITGYTKDEADGVVCRMFLTMNRGLPNEYVRSKADLTTVEMGELIDSVIMLLAQNGCVVEPKPLQHKESN